MITKLESKAKLIDTLHNHLSIKIILGLIGLSLNEIFDNFSFEAPKEYEPNVGWLISWNDSKFKINPEHMDLVQIVLKFAWSYTTDSTDERLKAFVNNELTMFEAGMKLYSIHQQQIKASQKNRTWKALDNWIIQKLKSKKRWTQQELWEVLPASYENKEIYREEDEVCCTKRSRNPIKFRAFCDHIRKVKGKIKYG